MQVNTSRKMERREFMNQSDDKLWKGSDHKIDSVAYLA